MKKINNNLIYHDFRFGLKQNFKVLLCRMVGHQINNDPSAYYCERCGLAYEEIYINKGTYYVEAGIVKLNKEEMKKYRENGNRLK